MKELLPPNEKQIYVHSQYQYLLQRLQEVKRQRPSTSTSMSDSEAQVKSMVSSSCYSSLLDIDSSIPCENQFIGDSCQGGVPNQCDTLSLCEEIETTTNNYTIRQYSGSKSTLPSVESANMSPRVSELEIDSTDSSKYSSGKHSPKKTGCTHCKTGRKSSLKSRTVRFRDPESEVLSSADDDIIPCECEPCHLCKTKYQTASSWHQNYKANQEYFIGAQRLQPTGNYLANRITLSCIPPRSKTTDSIGKTNMKIVFWSHWSANFFYVHFLDRRR